MQEQMQENLTKAKSLLSSRNFWIAVLIVAFIIVVFVAMNNKKKKDEQESYVKKLLKDKISEQELELNQYLRKLFSDHTFWIRMYMISYVNNSKDLNVTTERLLKNQEQIGRAIGIWYGDKEGKKVTNLFKENLISFGEALKEMTAKNKNGVIVADRRWNESCEKIAEYMAEINPQIEKAELMQNFRRHCELISEMVGNRFKNKFKEETIAFDKANNHAMYEIANTITKGIVKQFPDKFN